MKPLITLFLPLCNLPTFKLTGYGSKMAADCLCRMRKVLLFSSLVLIITGNCIYSSKPFKLPDA